MTEDTNFDRATRLRAAANEMLQLANEIEQKYTLRVGKVMAHEFASLNALAALAAKSLSDRLQRHQVLGDDLFGEPAWDMLLHLFVSAVEKKKVYTTAVTNASGVPHSTALRYLRILEQRGLIEFCQADSDHRVRFVALTQEGMVRMSACLARHLRRETYNLQSLGDASKKVPARQADKLTALQDN